MTAPRVDVRASGPLVVGAVAFVVYALMCLPVSGMGDGSEFTLVLATGGVAHPTGYPLYTLVGHAFGVVLHAAGVSWPLATNLWSAAGAAVAVGFLFALALRLTPDDAASGGALRFAAALIPTALFGLQPILLIDATAGEVNAWSAAWTCLAAWVFVRVLARLQSPDGEHGASDRPAAVLWGLVCGAGLAHHLASVLVSVPLTVALAATAALRRRPLPPLALRCALAACIPLASYGFIAWRAWNPAVVQWPVLTPSPVGVWEHVSGAQYRHFFGYFAPAPDHRALIEQVALPFVAAGTAALGVALVRSREAGARTVWAAFASAIALVAAFTFRYGVPDPAPYLLPAMALAAAAAGVLIAPWLDDAVGRRRDIEAYEKLIRSMWTAVPSDTAIVFWPDDRYLRLREYQLLGGEKPEVLVLNPNLLVEDGTREGLRRRFGVDPLDGHPIPAIEPGSPDEEERIRRYLKQVIRDFNRRIRPPVIIFDPGVPIVQQLRKP